MYSTSSNWWAVPTWYNPKHSSIRYPVVSEGIDLPPAVLGFVATVFISE